MKKLRLNLESLSVQTFEADGTLARTRRTVLAHQIANPASGADFCHTWDRFNAYCALSRGMEVEWGCTPVCEP